MCFWFDLEILWLVYKKFFFKYRTVSILFDLLTSKKSSTTPNKTWKKLVCTGYQKRGILRWFQKCAEVLSLAKGETILQKNLFFRT